MSEAVTVRRALAQSGLVPVDAHALLGHVLGRNRAWLSAHGDDLLDVAQAGVFFGLAKRRRDGEPVAYLTGTREFWGLALAVSPAVLIPRPETETLVELALARLPVDRPSRVLDLGTGSGAIALALAHERPLANVLATDASADALAVARGNAARLGFGNVAFALADWYSGLPADSRTDSPTDSLTASQTASQTEPHADSPPHRNADPIARFDLIVSNPPYVASHDPHLAEGDLRYEPASALAAGIDGLAALRAIIAGAPGRLVPGGTLAVEHGHDQGDAVRGLFAAAGFADVVASRDLAGISRVVAGRTLP